jgi:hypothetical protein
MTHFHRLSRIELIQTTMMEKNHLTQNIAAVKDKKSKLNGYFILNQLLQYIKQKLDYINPKKLPP